MSGNFERFQREHEQRVRPLLDRLAAGTAPLDQANADFEARTAILRVGGEPAHLLDSAFQASGPTWTETIAASLAGGLLACHGSSYPATPEGAVQAYRDVLAELEKGAPSA